MRIRARTHLSFRRPHTGRTLNYCEGVDEVSEEPRLSKGLFASDGRRAFPFRGRHWDLAGRKEVSGVTPLKKARSTSGNLDGIEPVTPNSSSSVKAWDAESCS